MSERTFLEDIGRRYTTSPIGDVTESLEDPDQYSLQTLWEMQILEMGPKKENWDDSTVDVHQEKFQKRVADFNQDPRDYFQKIWEIKR